MSVKLSEVMSATHARRASLAAEVAGYLVLAVADQVAGAPRSLGFADVSLGEEGQVKLAGGTPSPDVSAERCLRAMLEAMLLESSSVTPGLMRASQKAAGAGVETLIREIEVALVPVNRAAARRALARLHKDVIRALERGNLAAWQPRVSLSDSPSGAPAPVPEERRPAPPPLPVAAATADATSLSVDLPAVLAEEPEEAAFSEVGSSAFLPREVAVVPVPDELRGEEVKVYVQLKAEESSDTVPPEAIIDFCKANLAAYKIPRFIEYQLTDFERTPSMRVQKKSLLEAKKDLRQGAWDRETGKVKS